MYVLSVLIEHPVHKLDRPFSYLSKTPVIKGVRVEVLMRQKRLTGYVLDVTETELTKAELEERDGFTYAYVRRVIDKKPLLNDELIALSTRMADALLCPRIACLQAMLPRSLKPATAQRATIKTMKAIRIIAEGPVKTDTQKKLYAFLQTDGIHFLKDIPFSRAPIDALVKQGLIEIYDQEVRRDPYGDASLSVKRAQDITLTRAQAEAVDGIMSHPGRTSLLHGVTGSGKTEVYIELTRRTLLQGKTVIMLVPEIALTPMMIRVFKDRFGDRVAVFHSRLSEGEKYDEYRRTAAGEVDIVVGARSAVFAPLTNIGLIILDEEHDSSYKQGSAPRYHTRMVATMRARTYRAALVLGSATPSVESYSRAREGYYDLYELPERINGKSLPECTIIDMNEEARKGNYSLMSGALVQGLEDTFARGEQAILLLNRRGYANLVRCEACGETLKCPHCDITLTYHKHDHRLKCHSCEYFRDLPQACPHCGSRDLKIIGYGTQKIEEQLLERFKGHKIIRYDFDTTRNKNDHLDKLAAFQRHEADMLVGTQMIAKGLDFENVTFVGVLAADLTLSVRDYRAAERTFQLLCQTAGRSGRGAKEGHVLIQTYNPNHYAIRYGASQDYAAFFKEELAFRRRMSYPPYAMLAAVILQGADKRAVEAAALDARGYLERALQDPQTVIMGPSGEGAFKTQDRYRETLMIRYRHAQSVRHALAGLLMYFDQTNGKVLPIVDFNPGSYV